MDFITLQQALGRTAVIIPAQNEAENIAKVLQALPLEDLQGVTVVNNASTDDTAQQAADAGAIVLHEARKGYGWACLQGMAYWQGQVPRPEYLAFLDGDFSDNPSQLSLLLETLLAQNADMVLGSRVLGKLEAGALTPVQRFGNWLSTQLLGLLYGQTCTDLGPFRILRFDSLLRLEMEDKTYGWTLEMQAKAALMGMKQVEIPVDYRRRAGGKSKVSGTVKGSVLAGYKILTKLFYLRFFAKIPRP